MQEYRSGHNEAVLKTVWVKAHGGSNPSACAKKSTSFDKKLVDFYSSRKAWYVITACRVWNCRKGYVIFGLITSLPTAKLHTAIADYIHAVGVIKAGVQLTPKILIGV